MSASDLPDLLRLACRTGKMRLNVCFSAQNGHQASLARSGQGWTVEHDRDALAAIEKVLRQQFGPMLERERQSRTDPRQIDLEEAIARASTEDLIG
jgi:hypothetical protein